MCQILKLGFSAFCFLADLAQKNFASLTWEKKGNIEEEEGKTKKERKLDDRLHMSEY